MGNSEVTKSPLHDPLLTEHSIDEISTRSNSASSLEPLVCHYVPTVEYIAVDTSTVTPLVGNDIQQFKLLGKSSIYEIRQRIEDWKPNSQYVSVDFPPIYFLFEGNAALPSDFALTRHSLNALKVKIQDQLHEAQIEGITSTHELSLSKTRHYFESVKQWKLTQLNVSKDVTNTFDVEAQSDDDWVMIPFHYGIHLFRVLSKAGHCEISRDLRAINFLPKDDSCEYKNHVTFDVTGGQFYFALPDGVDNRGSLIRYHSYSNRHRVLDGMLNHNGYIFNNDYFTNFRFRAEFYFPAICLFLKSLSTFTQDVFYGESLFKLFGINVTNLWFGVILVSSLFDSIQTFWTRYEKQKIGLINALLNDFSSNSKVSSGSDSSSDVAGKKDRVNQFNNAVFMTTIVQGFFVFGFLYRCLSRIVESDGNEIDDGIVVASLILSSCVANTFYQYRSGEEYYDRLLTACGAVCQFFDYLKQDWMKMMSVTIAVFSQFCITIFNANATFYYTLDVLASIFVSDVSIENSIPETYKIIIQSMLALLFMMTISFPIAGSGVREIMRSSDTVDSSVKGQDQDFKNKLRDGNMIGIIFENHKPCFQPIPIYKLRDRLQYSLNVWDALVNLLQQATALVSVTGYDTDLALPFWFLLSFWSSYPSLVSSQHNIWKYNPRILSSLSEITDAYITISGKQTVTYPLPVISFKLIKKILCALNKHGYSESDLIQFVNEKYFSAKPGSGLPSRESATDFSHSGDGDGLSPVSSDQSISDLSQSHSEAVKDHARSDWNRLLAFLLVQVHEFENSLPSTSPKGDSCCDLSTYESLMIFRTYGKGQVAHAKKMANYAEGVAKKILVLVGSGCVIPLCYSRNDLTDVDDQAPPEALRI